MSRKAQRHHCRDALQTLQRIVKAIIVDFKFESDLDVLPPMIDVCDQAVAQETDKEYCKRHHDLNWCLDISFCNTDPKPDALW